jgi:hypothetical protein
VRERDRADDHSGRRIFLWYSEGLFTFHLRNSPQVWNQSSLAISGGLAEPGGLVSIGCEVDWCVVVVVEQPNHFR